MTSLIRKKIPTPPPMAIEINLPALGPIFSAFMIFSITVCVLSQRFTVGDLSLSFINTPQVSPLQERGFSICVTCVGVLVVCLCDRYKRYIRNCLFHNRGSRGYVITGV